MNPDNHVARTANAETNAYGRIRKREPLPARDDASMLGISTAWLLTPELRTGRSETRTAQTPSIFRGWDPNWVSSVRPIASHRKPVGNYHGGESHVGFWPFCLGLSGSRLPKRILKARLAIKRQSLTGRARSEGLTRRDRVLLRFRK
jgi:hypothetical protein